MYDFINEYKCCMASYCKYAKENTYCSASNEVTEKCPYLKAISQIALLSMEVTEAYK